VASWPLGVVGSDGSRLGFGEALGPGGHRVELLLAALMTDDRRAAIDAERLAKQTPTGTLHLPVSMLALPDAVEAAASLDSKWLAAVEARRSYARHALLEAGRGQQLEAALHVAMLLGAEALDPHDDTDVGAHVASGAMLWILGGAVAWALTATQPTPFASWASLVVHRRWPVGPSRGRLVLSAPR